MRFRDRLLATLRQMQPILDIQGGLPSEQKAAVLSGLTVVSLMKPIAEMPDPAAARGQVAKLLKRLEAVA